MTNHLKFVKRCHYCLILYSLPILLTIACKGPSRESENVFDYQPYGDMTWIGAPILYKDKLLMYKIAFEKDSLIARVSPKKSNNFFCYHPNGEIYIKGTWSTTLGLKDRVEIYDETGVMRKIINYYFGEPSGGTTNFNKNGEFIKYEYSIKGKKLLEFNKDKDSLFINKAFCPVIITSKLIGGSKDSILLRLHVPSPPGYRSEVVYFRNENPQDSIIFSESIDSNEDFSLLLSDSVGTEDDLRIKYYLKKTLYSKNIIFSCDFTTGNPRLVYDTISN